MHRLRKNNFENIYVAFKIAFGSKKYFATPKLKPWQFQATGEKQELLIKKRVWLTLQES